MIGELRLLVMMLRNGSNSMLCSDGLLYFNMLRSRCNVYDGVYGIINRVGKLEVAVDL